MKNLRFSILIFLSLLSAIGVSAKRPDSAASLNSFELQWSSLEEMNQELKNLSAKVENQLAVAIEPLEVNPKAKALLSVENFQSSLFQAMVIDPVYNENRPHISQRALDLTEGLKKNLQQLQSLQGIASAKGIEKDFTEYLTLMSAVIKERQQKHYSAARKLLKDYLIQGKAENFLSAFKKDVESSHSNVNQSSKIQSSQPEIAQLTKALVSANVSLQMLRNEITENLEVYEKNKSILQANQKIQSVLQSRYWWIEKLVPSLFAICALTIGMGSFLLMRRTVSSLTSVLANLNFKKRISIPKFEVKKVLKQGSVVGETGEPQFVKFQKPIAPVVQKKSELKPFVRWTLESATPIGTRESNLKEHTCVEDLKTADSANEILPIAPRVEIKKTRKIAKAEVNKNQTKPASPWDKDPLKDIFEGLL